MRRMRKFKSSQLIRALATIIDTDGGNHHVYCDKIKGGRSIKVWGWKEKHYNVALDVLKTHGIPAKLVLTPEADFFWRGGGNIRIHTVEKPIEK